VHRAGHAMQVRHAVAIGTGTRTRLRVTGRLINSALFWAESSLAHVQVNLWVGVGCLEMGAVWMDADGDGAGARRDFGVTSWCGRMEMEMELAGVRDGDGDDEGLLWNWQKKREATVVVVFVLLTFLTRV
jgi:hypothetical protein